MDYTIRWRGAFSTNSKSNSLAIFFLEIIYLWAQKRVKSSSIWRKSTIVQDNTLYVFLILQNFINSSSKSIPYLILDVILIRLACKYKLKWNTEADKAFETLKKSFATVSVLMHTNFQKFFFLEKYIFHLDLKQYFHNFTKTDIFILSNFTSTKI